MTKALHGIAIVVLGHAHSARSGPQLRTIISWAHGPTQGPIGQACVGPDRVPRGATLTDSALHGRARAEPTQSPRGQDLGKAPPQVGLMFHAPTSGGGLPKSCPCTTTWARKA